MLDEELNASREHKSNVFAMLFSEPQATIELYNAVTGKNYPPDTKIEIVTLSNALFNGQLNDVAFLLDGKLVVLMEHQSTINNNMPLRMLIYMGREYEIMTKGKDLYRKKLIEIPAPEFIVLYNGKEEFPDFKEFRLSDTYGGMDTYGFAALPGGSCGGNFAGAGIYGNWWSASDVAFVTELGGDHSYYSIALYDGERASFYAEFGSDLRSVRCLKD